MHLKDRITFWFGMESALLALGCSFIALAATEYHPPWDSAWFIAGAVMAFSGWLSLIWATVLYFRVPTSGDERRSELVRDALLAVGQALARAAVGVDGFGYGFNCTELLSSSHEVWKAYDPEMAGVIGGETYLCLADAFARVESIAMISAGRFSGFIVASPTEADLRTTSERIQSAQRAVAAELAKLEQAE